VNVSVTVVEEVVVTDNEIRLNYPSLLFVYCYLFQKLHPCDILAKWKKDVLGDDVHALTREM
jgi:hypothetical protein